MTSTISTGQLLGGATAEPPGRSGDVRALKRHRPSAFAATRLFSAGSGTLLVLIWSSGYLVGKIGRHEVPPFALLWWRFMVAAVATQFAAIYPGLDMGASQGLRH